MGLIFRKRMKLGESGKTWLNLSGAGASLSHKFGDRVTVNSRGRITVRLFRGVTWRIGR